MDNLIVDGFSVFFTVKPHEDVFHEGLLVGCKGVTEPGFGDVPVVVDLQAKRMVKVETDSLALFLVQAFEELCHQCLRRVNLWACGI